MTARFADCNQLCRRRKNRQTRTATIFALAPPCTVAESFRFMLLAIVVGLTVSVVVVANKLDAATVIGEG